MNKLWAVVTGASSGIGKEIAIELSKKGYNLILVARRLHLLEELAKNLNVETICLQADLTDESACHKVFMEATLNKNIQILINNAGIGDYGSFVKTPLERHLKMIDLNIKSVTILAHLFANHMLNHKQQSYILNVASIGAFQTVPKLGAYCGTKKYVKDVSETMSYELENSNVSVSCLSPGGTYTEFMENANQVLKKGSDIFMMSASSVAQIAVRQMFVRKRQIVPGLMNWLTTIFAKVVPSKLQLSINNFFYTRAVEEVH